MGQMTIEELAERTHTSPRTIRYYIAEGMLPSPGARGRAANYGGEHLARLQLLRTLLARRLPLAEIKRTLAGLSLPEIQALLDEEQERQHALDQAAQTPSPKRYISELLRQTQVQQSAHSALLRQPKPQVGSPPSAKPVSTPLSTSSSMSARAQHISEWQRIALTPDIELHVRAEAAERLRPLLDALVALAQRET